MAEAPLFTVGSQLIAKIAYPALKGAYKGGKSIVEAREALDKLRETIQTIQARLLDTEKNPQESASVKDWIKRLKGVLYDAEDLFDKVDTDDMLKQQTKGDTIFNKVWVSSFKLNPIASRISIAMKVKAIRKRFLDISTDLAHFTTMSSGREGAMGTMSIEEDPVFFPEPNQVFGRDEDKKSILEMVLNEYYASDNSVPVIAIVGIGGMGKTTLAKLVYQDEEIRNNFEKKWFACISNTSNVKELLEKLFQSVCKKSYRGFTITQLADKLQNLIEGKKFLLVLDGVWEDDYSRLQNQMNLFSLGAKGSKIIVTTRSLSVARGMKARIHDLKGLSNDKSWALFKKFAFDREQENDSNWIELGKEIVKKCANVPLAIKCIGSLLHLKDSIQEWESFRNDELSKIRQNGQLNIVMSVLKLSYNQLDSNQKQCFAYCSLFPKNYIISKQELIYLWIAQGYIIPENANNTVEDTGHSLFLELLRRSLFQVDTRDLVTQDVVTCKMHDLIHDLAQLVADDESIMLTTSSNKTEWPRHVSVGYAIDGSWAIPTVELKVKRVRSFLFMDGGSVCRPTLIQEFAKYKFLRALSLKKLQIENVSNSIGELRHLRYLDLSETTLTGLPKSITKLLNLQTLDVHECEHLEVLPNDFRKLINLRRLDIRGCEHLKHMPPSFGELTSLQHLDEFKVGSGGQRSKLEALIGMNLRGKLKICFEDDTDDWSGVEYWQPPIALKQLTIVGYSGVRIPHWADDGAKVELRNLTHLSLFGCSKVECLPTFRHLPNLKYLYLRDMKKLDYIEGADKKATDGKQSLAVLKHLLLFNLPSLKAWSRRVDEVAPVQEEPCSSSTDAPPQLLTLSSLSTLHIDGCPELESLALFPGLRALPLKSVNARVISQLLSICDSPSSSSSSLKHVSIVSCDGLTSFPGKSLTSLQYLFMSHCNKMKYVELTPGNHNALEVLYLCGCPELELWEKKKRGVDWDSLPNLRQLRLDEVPPSGRLPGCLKRRQAHGELEIEAWTYPNTVKRQPACECSCAKYCLRPEPSMLRIDHQQITVYGGSPPDSLQQSTLSTAHTLA